MEGGPQRLLDRVLGRPEPPVPADDAVARMIARTTGRIRPEREYRWRLRGRVVNQYVAMREGLVPNVPAPQHMGRLGRAVLFASLGLAISVSAVGAASSSALPGDPLYGVKRQVEAIRIEIAPPSVRPMLAAMAFEARLSELELLAAAHDWPRVALAEAEVGAAVTTLAGLGGAITASESAKLAHHTQVLTELLATAPSFARAGLERALTASAPAGSGSNSGNHFGQENQVAGPGTAGKAGAPTNGQDKGTSAQPGPTSPSPAPASPSPTPSAPARTQPPHPSGSPHPGPNGAAEGQTSQPVH